MQSNSEIFLNEREDSFEEMIEQQKAQSEYEDQLAEQYQQELNEQSITAIKLFDGLTKGAIKEIAATAIVNVLNNGNPLEVAESLSAMELFIKEVKDDKRFKDYVREEAAKTPKGFISKTGAKIELAETGTAYDYSQCGDAELEMLDASFKSAEASLKERKEFLKKIPTSGIDVIVPFSGEVIHIYPPSKSSISSYKITLAK